MDDGAIFGVRDAVAVAACPAGVTTKSRPRALLFTTECWPTAAMLANAMSQAGFEVEALCPKGHPVRALGACVVTSDYDHLVGHRQLARTVDAFVPDLIVPCDDTAVAVLHAHYTRCCAAPEGRGRAELIARSLGNPKHFELMRRKSAFVCLAAADGIRTPATVVIESGDDLRARLAGMDYPLVVKADGWSGGRGTRIVRSAQEAIDAYESLSRPISWAAAVKDSLREGAARALWLRLGFKPQAVTLQAFAPGAPVNRAVICRNGAVLAGRTFEAVETMPNNGNATVVRPRRIPAIDDAVERCVALLGLSGFVGFDFMYDEASDAAYLLEVNPRATSACYTAPRGEANLADCLGAVMINGAGPVTPGSAGSATPLIALFPQEIERDRESAHLRHAEQQTPLDRPELVNACLALAARRTPYARAVEAVRRLRDRQPRA